MASENIAETSKPDRLLTTLQRLLELCATDVTETLHKTAQLVAQALGVEKVDVFLYDPNQVQAPDELMITADRDRIQQVLENLLSNATTYADSGTSVQVVIVQEQRRDASWITVTVSNQGPEIPPELLASL